MSTEITAGSTAAETTGGFVGDPAEAFRPPAAGGCCGSGSVEQSGSAGACCGNTDAAQAAGACCTPEAKAQAVADGAGCCG
jgi:hypothetical protein